MTKTTCGVLLALCMILLLSAPPAVAESFGLNEVFEAPRAFEAVQDMTLRQRPDKNSESTGAVHQGEIVSVSGLENGWFKVTRSDGTIGFIYQRFLKPSQAPVPVPGATPQPPAAATAATTPQPVVGGPGALPEAQPGAAGTGVIPGGPAATAPAAPTTSPQASPQAPGQALTPAVPAQSVPAPSVPPGAEVPAPSVPPGAEVPPPSVPPGAEVPPPGSQPVPGGSAINAAPGGQPVPGGSAISSAASGGSAAANAGPGAQQAPGTPAVSSSGATAPEPRPKSGGSADCYRLTLNEITATGSVRNTLVHAVQDCYLLSLLSNQWLEVWISSADNGAVFELFSPKGASLIRDEMHWLGKTDVGGDYIILVNSRKGKTEYTLKVQVR